MTTYRLGVLIGSLSTESINRRLFTALQRLATPLGLELREIAIGDLPMYNRDLDYDLPERVQQFKAEIAQVDGVLLVTPEYNRSVPAVLKNALEWVSRPWGVNALAGKPSAVIGGSIGPVGTAVAQQHLHSILSTLGSPELAGPEAFLHLLPGLIEDDGDVTDESTTAFLVGWLQAVRDHVARTLFVVA